MAVRYVFTALDRVNNNGDIVGSASGGTLTGTSATVNIVWDDAKFDNTIKGKENLLNVLDRMIDIIQTATNWPIDNTL